MNTIDTALPPTIPTYSQIKMEYTPDSLINICIKKIWHLFNMDKKIQGNNANIQYSYGEMERHIVKNIMPKSENNLCTTLIIASEYLKIDNEGTNLSFAFVTAFITAEDLELDTYSPGKIEANKKLCDLLSQGLQVSSDALLDFVKHRQKKDYSVYQENIWKKELKLIAKNIIFRKREDWETLLFQPFLLKDQKLLVCMCQVANEIFKVRFSLSTILTTLDYSFNDTSLLTLVSMAGLDAVGDKRTKSLDGVERLFRLQKDSRIIVKALGLFEKGEVGYSLLRKLFTGNKYAWLQLAKEHLQIFQLILSKLSRGKHRPHNLPFKTDDILNMMKTDPKFGSVDDLTITLMIKQMASPNAEEVRELIRFAIEQNRNNEVFISLLSLVHHTDATQDFINHETFQLLLNSKGNDSVIVYFFQLLNKAGYLQESLAYLYKEPAIEYLYKLIDHNRSDDLIKNICGFFVKMKGKLPLPMFNKALIQKKRESTLKFLLSTFGIQQVSRAESIEAIQYFFKNEYTDEFIVKFVSAIIRRVNDSVAGEILVECVKNIIAHAKDDELIQKICSLYIPTQSQLSVEIFNQALEQNRSNIAILSLLNTFSLYDKSFYPMIAIENAVMQNRDESIVLKIEALLKPEDIIAVYRLYLNAKLSDAMLIQFAAYWNDRCSNSSREVLLASAIQAQRSDRVLESIICNGKIWMEWDCLLFLLTKASDYIIGKALSSLKPCMKDERKTILRVAKEENKSKEIIASLQAKFS